MKSADCSPPFPRGEIYDPAAAGNVLAPNNPLQTIGREWDFQDINLLSTSRPKPQRSGNDVTCRLMKNTSGVVLYPKRIVTIDPDNPGYATGLAAVGNADDLCAIVDEYIPSTGVPINSLFWAVVEGRGLMVTDATASTVSITAGMFIVPATGGFANGSGTIHTLTTGIIDSAALRFIRNSRFEARDAYTGSAAAADIDCVVHRD